MKKYKFNNNASDFMSAIGKDHDYVKRMVMRVKDAFEYSTLDSGVDLGKLLEYVMNSKLDDLDMVILGGMVGCVSDERMQQAAAHMYASKQLKEQLGDILADVKPSKRNSEKKISVTDILPFDTVSFELDKPKLVLPGLPNKKPKTHKGKYDFGNDGAMPISHRIGISDRRFEQLMRKVVKHIKLARKLKCNNMSFALECVMNEPGMSQLERVYIWFHQNYKRSEMLGGEGMFATSEKSKYDVIDCA